MKTVFAWSLLLFLTGKQLTAQSMGKIAIGEKIPPITIKNVYQNPGAQISFQQLKGKLIIIDFWNSWCGTCIEGFPDLERLQQQFSDRIGILLVTSDPERQV
ncbi:MAG TPA: TlpA disulfide reductase family protein, partial [Puia sp.]